MSITTARDYHALAGRWVTHPGGGWSGEILGECDARVRIQWHDGQVYDYSHAEVDAMTLLDADGDGDEQDLSHAAGVRRFQPLGAVVDAVRLDHSNAYAVARWCGARVGGTFGPDLMPVKPVLHLNGTEGATQVRLGDWIYRDGRGFRSRPDALFTAMFTSAPGAPVARIVSSPGNQPVELRIDPSDVQHTRMPAEYVVTAHRADDTAHTVAVELNLIRDSGGIQRWQTVIHDVETGVLRFFDIELSGIARPRDAAAAAATARLRADGYLAGYWAG